MSLAAGGHIAIEYVACSKPNGYTIYLFAVKGVATMAVLLESPPVDVS